MRVAAQLGVSGLIALILIEVLKYVLPVVMVWVTAALLWALKAALTLLAIVAALVALVGAFFAIRYVVRRRNGTQV